MRSFFGCHSREQRWQKERELQDYLTERADDLFEPEWDSLH
jgi:hypothetical protein